MQIIFKNVTGDTLMLTPRRARARSGGKTVTDFITLAAQAGGTPTHHARNCAWAGYLWARVWAPPEIAEIWYLLAARMQTECERIDAGRDKT